MIRRILIFIMLFAFPLIIYGQDNIQDRLVSSFEKQSEVFQQEKIYIHTDKPYYISGEKILFRAYLVDAQDHKPVSESRFVYVELINSFNMVTTRVKILQEEGTYHGYLPIPEDAPEGDYTMRAYTVFMQNLDENYFFTKSIYIGDPKAQMTDKASSTDNDFDVSFYPEGGSLMQGTFCKVAFKAMKSDGRPADISGMIYDQAGTEIKAFKSEYLGMGCFPLLAEKGKNYYAICQDNKGKSIRFDLPAAIAKGYAISISGNKDKMYVTVLRSEETEPNEELYLLAHTRGMVHFADRWDIEKNHIIQTEEFSSGVLHLILFDTGLNPVSERLVFINNQDRAQVSYQPDQENYTARSLVKNSVTLTDIFGEPLAGSFSVAVTSDNEVQTDSTSNILTQLLLTSDLRGNIENPAYYFQKTTTSASDLDLLMLTQGWRRYNIEEITQGRYKQPKFPIENVTEISGMVKNDLLGTPARNIEVNIMSLKYEYFDKTKTDKDGRFSFNVIEWPDSTSFTVSVKKKKTTTAKNLIIDKESFPKRTLFTLPRTGIEQNLFSQYAGKAEQQYVSENGMRMIHLSEVNVSAKSKQLRKSNLYNYATHTITSDFMSKYPATNILYHLRTAPGVIVNLEKKTVAFIRNIDLGGTPPCMFVDGVLYAKPDELPDLITTIQPFDIAQIDILSGSSAAAFGPQASGGAIVIYTKTIEDYKNDEYVGDRKNIAPLGYQLPIEFYAPKYDTPEKRNAPTSDFRTTIHWQPVVQANSQGEASFEFYTADEPTSYTVIIEGIADDGSIIWKEEKLLINGK